MLAGSLAHRRPMSGLGRPPQSLNLSQKPVQLVPTREDAAHHSTQHCACPADSESKGTCRNGSMWLASLALVVEVT